ncbi:MAG: pSer/pThr/pTyr-binding forkhead associated (FHA) protein [Planctomycetota bacterium]|jgi:pSer/pThr/pTyr-binding forkhead associated (FHA) protein
MTNTWTLQVIENGQAMHELAARDGLTIGRHPDCDLVLKDSHVSARHAKIVTQGEQLAITDLGSNNGTHIDNTAVLHEGQEQVLRADMHIAIGRVELVVRGKVDANADTLQGDMTLPAVEPDSHATIMGAPSASGSGTVPAPDEEPTMRPPSDKEQEVKTALPAITPVPVARPSAPPKPTPVPQASGSSFGAFDSVALNTILGDADNDIGANAKLVRMGARLIVLNEADMRGVDVEHKEFTVGRKPEASCSLPNRGVSSEHARIVFNPRVNTFFIEDLGSANGTQLDGAPLALNAPRELHSDAHIRFGTIEAVFLQSTDSELIAIPAERHALAAKLLGGRGQLPSADLKRAKQEAKEQGLSLGECLLLGKHVGPREWARAVADARVAATVNQLGGSDSKRVLLWMLVGLLLAGAALMATPAGRKLLGFGS